MGNGTEDDYNFVFKGKLGFLKKEGAWERPAEAVPPVGLLLLCFFFKSLTRTP